MPYRNIIIASETVLHNKNGQLVVSGQNHQRVPLEDIKCIVLENLSCQVSISTLQKMVANGTAVYICDEKHLPSAVLLPFFQHSRTGSVIEGQCSLSIPTVKMLGNKLLSQKLKTKEDAWLYLAKKRRDDIYTN